MRVATATLFFSLNNNLDFFRALEAQKSEPILDRINASGSNFGCLGAAGSSDAPGDSEWCVLWLGSYKRITVIAVQYGTNNAYIYIRAIFDGKWLNNDWISLHGSN